MLLKTVAENIRTMRQSRSLTQRELAKRLGVSASTIAMWETEKREPDFEALEALADEFNVPLSAITGQQSEVDIIPISAIKMHSVPLLGSVAAGSPINDQAFPDEYVQSPMDCDFALNVKGESMHPTFMDGDVVYCKTCTAIPYDGAIVVIRMRATGECCIKHVLQAENGVVIVSDNPEYPARLIPADQMPEVLGIPVGFTRILKKVPLASKG